MTTTAEPPAPRWHPRGFNNRIIFAATQHGVSRLPTWITYPIARFGTWIAYRLQTTGREAVIDNLRAVCPGAGDAELERLALGTYRSYARDVIDFIRSLSRSPDQLRQMLGRRDTASFDEAIRAGRGVLAVSAHFGNWEIGGVFLRHLTDHALSVVAMREPSEDVTRRRRELRAALGIGTIEVRQSLETGLRIRDHLARNEVVAMLIDRHFGRDRVAVSFFGRRAYFLRTPAVIASWTGAPLVPMVVFRLADGRFAIETGPAIYVEPGNDRNAAIASAAQALAAFFESQIARHPEAWYQFYPFWATQETVAAAAPSLSSVD